MKVSGRDVPGLLLVTLLRSHPGFVQRFPAGSVEQASFQPNSSPKPSKQSEKPAGK
jgi:hypothetical protein